VLAEELDNDDPGATNATRASRPAPVEILFDRRGGYARLPGCVSYADVDVVSS
jgi:hypothetical protein